MTVSIRCACGLVISARADSRSIAHALRVHYGQPEHVQWRERQELHYELLPSLDVPVATRAAA